MKNLQRRLWRGRRGENICVSSANYISLADRQTHTATLEQRMARGYDINAQYAVLPGWVNTSVSLEQYLAIAWICLTPKRVSQSCRVKNWVSTIRQYLCLP